MTKKIFDILPPNQVNEQPSSSKEPKSSSVTKKRKKSFWKNSWWKISLAILIFLGLGGFIYQSGWATVDVTLSPTAKSIQVEKRVTINVNQESVDTENIVIPGKLVSEEIEKSRQFEAQGEKKKKASGTITVYNSYSNPTTPINLIAQTRFLSNSGYYFLSKTPIHIPAAHY